MSQTATQKVHVTDVAVFQLADLLVDEANFRLEPNADQPTAIKSMLRRQGRKLVSLAEEILESGGLSAGEFIWLAPDPRPEMPGKYIVCEGNRRITALKLMNHPGLADGTSWSKRFRELADRFAENPITEVRAVLYPSLEAVRPDVYRRHTNAQDGAGLEAWDPFAQDRANKAAGQRRNLSMVVLEHLSHGSAEALAEQLGLQERTTNADRLLGTFSKNYAANFGMKLRGVVPHIDLGPDPEIAEALLLAILKASDVPVDKIKTEKMRADELERLIAEVRANFDELRRNEDSSTSDEPSTDPSGDGRTGKPGGSHHVDGGDGPQGGERDREAKGKGRGRGTSKHPLDRKTLARLDAPHALKVKSPRLAGLYVECRRIQVDEMTNAAAMLLRVFVELSCEAYLEHHGVRPPDGKPNWSARNISLEKKAKRVLTRIDSKQEQPELNDARNGIAEGGQFSHSVNEMHRAMHDLNTYLDPRTVKASWDRWFPVLAAIHESID